MQQMRLSFGAFHKFTSFLFLESKEEFDAAETSKAFSTRGKEWKRKTFIVSVLLLPLSLGVGRDVHETEQEDKDVKVFGFLTLLIAKRDWEVGKVLASARSLSNCGNINK